MAEVGSLGYHEPVRHVPGELTVQNHFTLVVLRTVTLGPTVGACTTADGTRGGPRLL